MSEMIDPNKIAAEFSIKLAERAATLLTGQLKRNLDRNRLVFTNGFARYARETSSRISQLKTLLRDDPIDISDIYVLLDFLHRQVRLPEDNLLAEAERYRKLLIIGTAGSGKSMFIRNCFLRIVREGSRLPILVELRSLAMNASTSLREYIHYQIQVVIPAFDAQMLEGMFLQDRITLLLDGLDEVPVERRLSVTSQLRELMIKYPRTIIFLTTRPDETAIEGDFYSYYVAPLTQASSVELISKLPFDADSKARFISDVRNSLYEKHTDFLSNPLLATMMLLTYGQFAEVPAKIHIFYQLAFETLFRRHDASKAGMYRRKMHTDLAMDEFQRIFSYFCARTYVNEQFSFSEVTLLSTLREGVSYYEIEANPEYILKDLIESICLLIKDGLSYRFVHRSFQEYFAAIFICELEEKLFARAVDSILPRISTDGTIGLIAQLAPNHVETYWVKERLRVILSAVRAAKSPTAALLLICSTIEIQDGDIEISSGTGHYPKFGDSFAALRLILGSDFWPFRHDAFQDFIDELTTAGGRSKVIRDYLERLKKVNLFSLREAPDSILELSIWSTLADNLEKKLVYYIKKIDDSVSKRRDSTMEMFTKRPPSD